MIFYRTLEEEVSSLFVRIAREAEVFEHTDIKRIADAALRRYKDTQPSTVRAETDLALASQKLIAILSSGRNWVADGASYSYFDAYEYREQLEILLNRLSMPREYRHALEATVKELETLFRQSGVMNSWIMALYQDFESTAYWSLRTESLEISTDKTLTLLRSIVEESKSSEYSLELRTKLNNLLTDFEVASLLSSLYADEKAI